MLQGHMDMVCEKNTGTIHDFLNDPLKLRVNGDFISAEGTTLGADNGIAVALCMAVLDDENITHPPLEIVFTSDEEAGMSGAEGLDVSVLTAKRMINMDTDVEGTFVTGCAGGVRVAYNLPAEWSAPGKNDTAFKLSIKGLMGGHSGVEINRERANSIRLLGRVLNNLKTGGVDYSAAYVSGGMKVNVIPREAEAVITVNSADCEKLLAEINAIREKLSREYRTSDPGLILECAPAGEVTRVMSDKSLTALITSLLLLPLGVQSLSAEIPGLVETSSNIGVMSTSDGGIFIECMPRGSVKSRFKLVKEQILLLAEATGARVNFIHEYNAWEYDPDSDLRKTIVDLYKETSGRDAVLNTIHAGLECGILGEKMPGLDMISFGPEIHGIHTPDERLSISSTERVWKFLTELFKQL